MSYSLLAEPLRPTADAAKDYFKNTYGAKNFACEQAIADDLPLKPTWRASTADGYDLIIEVRELPMAPAIHEFVNKCAVRGIPFKLWVVVRAGSGPDFMRGLKEAKEIGVGVVSIPEDGGAPHVFQRPVPLSLFALRKTDLKLVANKNRQIFKDAEDAFVEGRPEDGCRQICEELEAVTRRFAKHCYDQVWWKPDPAGKQLKEKFFTTDSWANMLEQLDGRIVEAKVKNKCPKFKRAMVAGVRQHTDWRNSLSHKVKTAKERESRDQRLRTMFEATRDLLVEWFEMARPLKLDT